jgi:signal transduction histidine kinase
VLARLPWLLRDADAREALQSMRFSTDAMSTVLDSVLDLEKIEAGFLSVEVAPMSLTELMTRAAKQVRACVAGAARCGRRPAGGRSEHRGRLFCRPPRPSSHSLRRAPAAPLPLLQVATEARARRVLLRVEADSAVPPLVLGDKGRLLQVRGQAADAIASFSLM